MSEPIYKTIDFDESHAKLIEVLVINGYSREDIAAVLGLSKTGFEKSLLGKKEIRDILHVAEKKLVGEATRSLKKLADGFVRYEREYVASLDKKEILKKRRMLQELLTKDDADGFLDALMTMTLDGSKNALTVKVKEIEVAPDKSAIIKILEALKEDTWDVEGRRKKIPQVKITVGLEGKEISQALKQKAIPADYTKES